MIKLTDANNESSSHRTRAEIGEILYTEPSWFLVYSRITSSPRSRRNRSIALLRNHARLPLQAIRELCQIQRDTVELFDARDLLCRRRFPNFEISSTGISIIAIQRCDVADVSDLKEEEQRNRIRLNDLCKFRTRNVSENPRRVRTHYYRADVSIIKQMYTCNRMS